MKKLTRMLGPLTILGFVFPVHYPVLTVSFLGTLLTHALIPTWNSQGVHRKQGRERSSSVF